MSTGNQRRKAQRRRAKAKEVRRRAANARETPVEGPRRKLVRQATDVAIAGLGDVRAEEASKPDRRDADALDVIEEERKLLEWRGLLETATRGRLRAAGLQGRAEAHARYALDLERHMKARHGAVGSIDTPDELVEADAMHESIHGRGPERGESLGS